MALLRSLVSELLAYAVFLPAGYATANAGVDAGLLGTSVRLPVSLWVESELKRLGLEKIKPPQSFQQEDLEKWAKGEAGRQFSRTEDLLLFLSITPLGSSGQQPA